MAASTNATRVFWGTAWTSDTLLGRELRAARAAEAQDGQRRTFCLAAPEVSAEVPAYGRFVAAQVAALGRAHPMVKSQLFSEEIDAAGGMFPPERLALLRGTHPRLAAPRPGFRYALLLDVAGEDEAAPALGYGPALANPQRDRTALVVVEIDPAGLEDPALRAARYRIVARRQWAGPKHTALYAQLLAQARHWNACRVVVDATGVGAGLASFLERALPGQVLAVQFNRTVKSRLGWSLIALVETGRLQDFAALPGDPDGEDLLRQAEVCRMEALPGPERLLAWGVPDGLRCPYSGQPLHDDLLVAAALTALLDDQPLRSSGPALVVAARDPLSDLDQGF